MKVKSKKLSLTLLFCVLAMVCLFAAACTQNDATITSIDVVGAPEGEYSIGSAFDYSQLVVTAHYSDGTTKVLSAADFVVSGWDASSAGEKSFVVTVGDIKQSFSYTVIQLNVTLDFNGGYYGTESVTETNIGYVGRSIDLTGYVPTKTDENGYEMSFAGWYTDAECTRRANVVAETFTPTSDVTLYAGYDTDWSWLFEYSVDQKLGEVTIEHFNNTAGMYSDPRYLAMDETLTIPNTIEGYPVTVIGENFIKNSELEDYAAITKFSRVCFMENSPLREIGESAFESASGYDYFEFPSNLKTIGIDAFSGSSFSAENVIFPASLEKIMDGAFFYSHFQQISFEEGSKLTIIGAEAFSGAEMSSIILPEGLQEIGASAFSGCPNITKINIPSTVSKIGLYAFNSMNALESIIVDENNALYTNDELYNLYERASDNQNNLYLIRYCTADRTTEFTLPSNTVKIGEAAFNVKDLSSAGGNNGYSYLKQINLNEGLTSIGDKAFAGISAEFVLPASLTHIDQLAFYDWEGSEFVIAEGNQNFSVKDGVLYSKDGTVLYCVPMNLEVADGKFTLDENVSEIKSYAFCKSADIEYLYIPQNSALVGSNVSVMESGLCIYTMPNLKAVYILCEPFNIQNGAFVDKNTAGSSSPTLFVSDREAFLAKWANYVEVGGQNYGTFGSLSLAERIMDFSQSQLFLCNYLDETLGFVPYAAFNQGVESYCRYSYNMYRWIFAVNMLSGIYNNFDVSGKYLEYFTEFENYSYQYAYEYFQSSLEYSSSSLTTTMIQYFFDYIDRYDLLPDAVKTAVQENYDALAAYSDTLNELLQSREDSVDAIMAFEISEQNLDDSASEFSFSALQALIAECEANGAANNSGNSAVQEKYCYLDCTNYIYQIVNYGVYDETSISEIMELNSYVESYFSVTFTYAEVRQSFYKYEQYLKCVNLTYCNYLMYALANEMYWEASDAESIIYDGNYFDLYGTFGYFDMSVEYYMSKIFTDEGSRSELKWLEEYNEAKETFDSQYPDGVNGSTETPDVTELKNSLDAIDFKNYDDDAYSAILLQVYQEGLGGALYADDPTYYDKYLLIDAIYYCHNHTYLETDNVTVQTLTDFLDGDNFKIVYANLHSLADTYKEIVGEEFFETSYYKTMLQRFEEINEQYLKIVDDIHVAIKSIDYTEEGMNSYRIAKEAVDAWSWYFYSIIDDNDYDYYTQYSMYENAFDGAEAVAADIKSLLEYDEITVENYKTCAYLICDSDYYNGIETQLENVVTNIYYGTHLTEEQLTLLLETYAGLGEGTYAAYKELTEKFYNFGKES